MQEVETKRKPELLAPAGDWDCLKAAAANGADAVYFGLDQFNARHRATNFTLAELPKVVEFHYLNRDNCGILEPFQCLKTGCCLN